jgi:hypothetical protein
MKQNEVKKVFGGKKWTELKKKFELKKKVASQGKAMEESVEGERMEEKRVEEKRVEGERVEESVEGERMEGERMEGERMKESVREREKENRGLWSQRVTLRLRFFYDKGRETLYHRHVQCVSTLSFLECMNLVRPTTIFHVKKLFYVYIVRLSEPTRLRIVLGSDVLDSMQLGSGDTLYVDCSPHCSPPL